MTRTEELAEARRTVNGIQRELERFDEDVLGAGVLNDLCDRLEEVKNTLGKS